MENTIIIGSGPCGMACAIELKKHGINPLVIEKENIVNTIYNFPAHQVFFSSSDKLEIGGMLFTTNNAKPVRSEALSYYRNVADRFGLRINTYEQVLEIQKKDNVFNVITSKNKMYKAKHVIVATGYYDQPNLMNIPGEELSKVTHYFKEAHPYYQKNVAVIGGKNSAIDAAIELYKAGANTTVLYRGDSYSPSIKPWILPEFNSLVKNKHIKLVFDATVTEIAESDLFYNIDSIEKHIKNDFVFAMTEYKPDIRFLKNTGISIDDSSGKPIINEQTLETNIANLFVAGVIVSGFNNNEVFIENGRFHAHKIIKKIIDGNSSQ